MFTLVIVIQIIVSIVMVIAVLLQSGKGAAIGSSFGGSSSQTLFGSAGPQTMLGKVTAVCAAIFMLSSLYLTYLSSRSRITSVMSGVPAKVAPVNPADQPQGAPTQTAPQAGAPGASAPQQPPAPAQRQ
ncbi:MAG: preprotein translocase subunit SecG [Deltaproteobacteria bacterium]|nr:preprotein translocase subunit SecG [Deltaproteobacteria bacterium]